MRGLIALLVIAQAWAPVSVAGLLSFKQTAVFLDIDNAAAKTVSSDFNFVNASKSQIDIVKIETSCGCTSAISKKGQYAAGESGVIKVEFENNDSAGFKTHYIYLYTNEKEDNIYTLVFNVNVPSLIDIKPGFVLWEGDNLRTSRIIDISFRVAGLTFVAATEPTKAFEVSSEVRNDGSGMSIKMTPLAITSGPDILSDLTIVFEAKSGRRINFIVPLRLLIPKE